MEPKYDLRFVEGDWIHPFIHHPLTFGNWIPTVKKNLGNKSPTQTKA